MPSRPVDFPVQPGPLDTTPRADHLHVAEAPAASRAQLVFVVHGRNSTARLALFEFLRSIGLSPIEWHQAIGATRKASPYIGEVVDAALEAAQAVVVLWTPDEVVSLRPEYADGEDDPDIRPGLQSRPNVMFEAGLALGRAPERVVLTELGRVRQFSDILGRHTVRLSNSVACRQELTIRLRMAGCAVDLSGTDWHTAGDFSSPPQPVLSRRIRGRNHRLPRRLRLSSGSAAGGPARRGRRRGGAGGPGPRRRAVRPGRLARPG